MSVEVVQDEDNGLISFANSAFGGQIYDGPCVGLQRLINRVGVFDSAGIERRGHSSWTSATATSNIAWNPTGCDPCACKLESDEFERRLKHHELRHEQEAQALADKLSNESAPFTLTACTAEPTEGWRLVEGEFNRQAFKRASRESNAALKVYKES